MKWTVYIAVAVGLLGCGSATETPSLSSLIASCPTN
jgi:hypothetical protein